MSVYYSRTSIKNSLSNTQIRSFDFLLSSRSAHSVEYELNLFIRSISTKYRIIRNNSCLISIKDNNACLFTLLNNQDISIFDSNSSERNSSSNYSIRVWNYFAYTFSSSSMLSVLENLLTLYTHSYSPYIIYFAHLLLRPFMKPKHFLDANLLYRVYLIRMNRGRYIICCLLTMSWSWLCILGFSDPDFFPSLVL